MNNRAKDLLRKILKEVNDFADLEGTDIIYGELRKEIEDFLSSDPNPYTDLKALNETQT